MYFIFGLAAVVGAAVLIAKKAIYAPQNFSLWLAAGALLAVGFISQSVKTVKQTEEMQWSL